MRISSLKYFFSIAAVVSTLLACRLFSAAQPTPSTPSTPQAGGPATVFEDDFSNSDSGWVPESTSDDTIEYANGGLRIKNWSGEWFTWSRLDGKTYKDIHLDVTARNDSQQGGYSFGLICDQKGREASFYYFVISASGEYQIGKSLNTGEFTILTNNGDWGESKLITKNAASYRIGADCGYGTLALYVDGNKIDTVTDSTFTEGGVALVLWSGEGSAGPVTFDDFVVTSLR